jgi:hypothetical protein
MWFKTLISFGLMALAALNPGCVHATDSDFPKPLAPKIVMHGDTSFTSEERKFIEESAMVWYKQTDGVASIGFVWDYTPGNAKSEVEHVLDHRVIRHSSDEPEIVEEDCEISEMAGYPKGICVPMLLAWVSPAGGLHKSDSVTLNFIPERYESKERWISVSIHEMGHVFGLPHSNFSQAVMWPSNDPNKTCLKQPDLVAFCAANDCGEHKMHPCE